MGRGYGRHLSRREIVTVPALFFEERKALPFLRLMAIGHDEAVADAGLGQQVAGIGGIGF